MMTDETMERVISVLLRVGVWTAAALTLAGMVASVRILIQTGIVVLIATPVARVAFSVFGFAREGDRLYVGITLFVLGTLLYGLFFGHV